MADRDLQRFVALAFCRADLLVELDEQHRIVFVAGTATLLLGCSPDALKGKPFLDILAEEDRRLVADLLKAAASQGRIDDISIRLKGAGRNPTVAMAGYRVPDLNNHFFVACKTDPQPLAMPPDERGDARDPVSGLMTEASFSNHAAHRLQMLKRAGGQPQLTIVRIDKLDELVKTMGASDRQAITSAVAKILSEASLSGDSAGAVDPKTFTLIHGQEVDVDEVSRKVMDATRSFDGAGLLSVRAKTLDADGAGMTEEQVGRAIAYAIQAYCADESNFGKKSLSQVLQSIVATTVDNVARIRRIAQQRAFDIVYMPICDLRVGRVHHFEALVRFHDLAPGESPYSLIALAEEIGVINDLDLAIADQSMACWATLGKRGNLPAVAINISGKSITSPKFVQALGEVLRANLANPKKIMFEITESAKIDDLKAVNQVIRKLGDRGFKFCLDDFGAGAAGLDYLNALDVDTVKFDGPVIKRALETAKGRDVLAGMARTCTGLGVQTVAEMVENAEIAAAMAQMGITYGQGWYFGKPTPDPFTFADRFA